MPVLEIDGATKTFGDVRALDGAHLSLNEGEWLGLLGPNGAGKTTLVRAIAGRVRIESGTISLLGVALDHTTPRHRLGVIPQEIAIYPTLTARENLESFAVLHGVAKSDIAQRTDWALTWTGLGDRAGDLVKTFSGGMKRRLNIACGVLHEPDVILLDEPTVGVDPQSRQRIWEMLEHLRSRGASLVLTTHQLDEAQQMCDRIVIIDHGKTIAEGTFESLVSETIGTGHQVTITRTGGERLQHSVDSIARDLSALLASVEGEIDDVRVESPTLQAVFIHLTGRELRE